MSNIHTGAKHNETNSTESNEKKSRRKPSKSIE